MPIFVTLRVTPDFTVKDTFFFRNQDDCYQVYLVKLKFVVLKTGMPFYPH